ncbi:hypothetical protein J3F84DRAFT_254428 [Trichoderma pleuroticola]
MAQSQASLPWFVLVFSSSFNQSCKDDQTPHILYSPVHTVRSQSVNQSGSGRCGFPHAVGRQVELVRQCRPLAGIVRVQAALDPAKRPNKRMTYFVRLTSSRPQRLTGPRSTERLTTVASCINRTGEQHDLNTDARKTQEMVADQGGTVQDIADRIRCSTTAPHARLGIPCSPFFFSILLFAVYQEKKTKGLRFRICFLMAKCRSQDPKRKGYRRCYIGYAAFVNLISMDRYTG